MAKIRVSLPMLAGVVAVLLCLAPSSVAGQAGASGAALSGSVRAADGRPLEGVGVSARKDDQRFTTTVYTDLSGDYSFPELAAGHYKIWA